MAREWEPGDVVMVTDPVHGERVALYVRDGVRCCWHIPVDGNLRCLDADQVLDTRPLVVIDPVAITGPEETGDDGNSREEIANCLRRLSGGDHETSYRRRVAERLADVFDPKPEEPTGLGAVVEAQGLHWVRAREKLSPIPWRSWPAGQWRSWSDLDDPVVLSEGVTL